MVRASLVKCYCYLNVTIANDINFLQLAKDINLHQKELSITFRRNIRNMLIIGLSSQIAVRAETVNVTAHRVGWNT